MGDERVVTVAAVDLGASSGRVLLARVGPDVLELDEVARFDNEPVEVDGTLHWDVLALWRGVVDGLRAAVGGALQLDGVGVDTWAVDFGLLDADGRLLGNPVHYRDDRTNGVVAAVEREVGAEALYATTGIQVLPINTLYQLVAMRGSAQLGAAARLLLVPDLLGRWLSGREVAEVTNASTTQLFDVGTRRWAVDVLDHVGVDLDLLPEVVEPGTVLGPLLPRLREQIGLDDDAPDVPVIAVASHDTAAAVVAVPAEGPDVAYVSCGTWSLVGLELDEPVRTEVSRRENFTNELGVDGTVRYLRNVMGLWLLSESRRSWAEAGEEQPLEQLLLEAAEVEPRRFLVDVDDPRFLPPGDMPARLRDACEERGSEVPRSPAEVARCVLDGLAVAYRRTVASAARLADREVGVVHVVGGGSQNALLCQMTADATGLPVVAGPVEATAIGNALVQARALGALDGGLDAMRALVRATCELHRYEPSGDVDAWAAAEAALHGDRDAP